MRHSLWLIIGCLLLFSAGGAVSAQDADWTAWLYDNNTGRVTKIDDTGRVLENFILPTVMGHTRYGTNVSVSHGGGLLAYTVYNPDMLVSQFMVYDTATDGWVITYSPGQLFADTIDFSFGSQIYNAFDSAVAYSYNVVDEGWHIVVFDIASRSEVFHLRSSDAAVVSLGIDSFLTPIVQDYSGGEIKFTMIAAGSEGALVNPSYTWNVVSNLVVPNTAYPGVNGDTFGATGEHVMAVFDERLPNQIDSLPLPFQLNALHVYDPEISGRIPFFASEAWTMGQPRFIQGGTRVLTNAYDYGTNTTLWPVIERNGTIVGFAPIDPADYFSIAGINEGFIYTVNAATSEGDTIMVMEVDTRSDALGAGRPVWLSETGTQPRIMWLDDNRQDNVDGVVFGPWRELASPIVDAAAFFVSPGDIPTATPLSGARILTVGGTAVVSTTEGDRLRVRSGPGTTFAIIARVDNGVRVALLEGPRTADGYRWWRISLPDGTEGWAVEEADGVRTLIPPG